LSDFIGYTTVFRSRLGAANLVMRHCGSGFIPEETLTRKVRADLEQTVEIDLGDPEAVRVLEFLTTKGVVGPSVRKSGRYRFSLAMQDGAWVARDKQGNELRRIEVAAPDLAMADPRLPSTVGTPTPENVGELLDFTYQLGLIGKAKRNLTAAGQAVAQIRLERGAENPFLLEHESVVLMRQLVERDGAMLRHLVAAVAALDSPISRSEFAVRDFPSVVDAMYADMAAGGVGPEVRRGAKAFRDLIRRTAEKASKASKGSRGPGVLEHRAAPRLEWLCDLRILTKEGLASNAFSYTKTSDLEVFLDCLWKNPGLEAGPDNVATAWWQRSSGFATGRTELAHSNVRDALVHAYKLMRRPVGPAAIREVVLLAALFCAGSPALSDLREELLAWALQEPGITVSGGRYRRDPELVHFRKDMLGST
jgi:hypothetical protein